LWEVVSSPRLVLSSPIAVELDRNNAA